MDLFEALYTASTIYIVDESIHSQVHATFPSGRCGDCQITRNTAILFSAFFVADAVVRVNRAVPRVVNRENINFLLTLAITTAVSSTFAYFEEILAAG